MFEMDTTLTPLSSILEIQQAPLTKKDLVDHQEQLGDCTNFLDTFDAAWSSFLKKRNQPLMGEREKRIVQLQKEVIELERAQETEEEEFKKQLEFLKRCDETTEATYKKKIETELERRRVIKNTLEEQIQTVEQADELQEHMLPWFHFLSETDRLAAEYEKDYPRGRNTSTLRSSTPCTKAPLPSCRAMFLASTAGTKESEDVTLYRATRIDNALLKAHTALLKKDIAQQKALLPIQKELASFMKDSEICKDLGIKSDDNTSSVPIMDRERIRIKDHRKVFFQ